MAVRYCDIIKLSKKEDVMKDDFEIKDLRDDDDRDDWKKDLNA